MSPTLKDVVLNKILMPSVFIAAGIYLTYLGIKQQESNDGFFVGYALPIGVLITAIVFAIGVNKVNAFINRNQEMISKLAFLLIICMGLGIAFVYLKLFYSLASSAEITSPLPAWVTGYLSFTIFISILTKNAQLEGWTWIFRYIKEKFVASPTELRSMTDNISYKNSWQYLAMGQFVLLAIFYIYSLFV